MLARTKLNIIGNKISKALIHNRISHEDSTTIINEEVNNWELKENIKMMKNQRSDAEKNILIEEGRRKGIDEFTRQNA